MKPETDEQFSGGWTIHTWPDGLVPSAHGPQMAMVKLVEQSLLVESQVEVASIDHGNFSMPAFLRIPLDLVVGLLAKNGYEVVCKKS